jgi:hypothetical protein
MLRQGVLVVIACSGALLGCTPKATVQRTTPVANLQAYRQVLVRGSAGQMAGWQGGDLANRTAAHVQRLCQFDGVVVGDQDAPDDRYDLVVDLNVLASGRGGGGLIHNPNLAVVDVAMVLSDGISDELLGSASIRGQSSAVVVSNVPPEAQALEVVAEQVGKILLKSGCGGQRLAREEPTPEETEPPRPIKPETTEEELAEAESLNNQGKSLFRSAKVDEARARFEAAIALNPDPRYMMNLCLAHEALKDYERAIATCRDVITAKPERRLVEKAEQRIQLIEDKRGGEA